LRDKWRDKANTANVTFTGNSDNFSRTQDSIVTDIVKTFNDKYLSVDKPDKKLSIIEVSFMSKDELFARAFVLNLVQNVNNFYVQTKVKNSYQNVVLLQKQADSVKTILNSSISGVASAIDATPNANPAMLTLRVPSQKKQVDVQANTAIYSEIIKNLELSKISLRQETPLIQVIDQPVLPLYNNHVSIIKGLILGTVLGFFIAVFALLSTLLFKLIF